MKHDSDYFEGREVKKLFYQYWVPDGEIKAYIVCIHDLATHSDRCALIAEYFAEQGYGLYSFDLRGHWRNRGEFPGHIDSMDHLQKDIILFIDVVKKKAEGKKIFVLGHSFGGLISLIYAINHPALAGVIVSSPTLGIIMESLFGKKVAKTLTKSISKLAPTRIIDIEVDHNLLTSDLKVLRKYIADKQKLNQVTVKTIAEMNNSIKWAMENAPKLICPVFIMQAGNDKLVDKSTTKQFADAVKSADKLYKEYDGFLHDLLHEKGRDYVYQDMYVWLEKHL